MNNLRHIQPTGQRSILKGKSKMKALIAAAVVAIFASAGSAYASTKSEWNYTMEPNSIGSNFMAAFVPGFKHSKAQLFQDKDGSYTFRLQGQSVDACFSQEIDATVMRTDTELTIVPAPRLRNCPQIRLVIKLDGTGGVVQTNIGKKGAIAWQTDEDHDYGLTPR